MLKSRVRRIASAGLVGGALTLASLASAQAASWDFGDMSFNPYLTNAARVQLQDRRQDHHDRLIDARVDAHDLLQLHFDEGNTGDHWLMRQATVEARLQEQRQDQYAAFDARQAIVQARIRSHSGGGD